MASLPVEAFFKFPDIGSAVLSPDGRHVAMTVRSTDGHMALVTCATDNLKSCKTTLKAGDDADIVVSYWINDQRLVVATGDLQGQNEYAEGKLVAADLDGSNIALLINSRNWHDHSHATASVVHHEGLDATYVFLRACSDGSDDILVGERTFSNVDYSMIGMQPFRYNTRTGVLKPMLEFPNPARALRWVFDRNDQPRVMTAVSHGQRTEYYRDANSTEWRSLGSFDEIEDKGFTPVAFDSDGTLLVLGAAGDHAALFRYDVKTGTLDAKPKLALEQFDYNGTLEYEPETGQLLGIHYVSDARGTVWFSAPMRSMQEQVDKLLPNTINTLSCGRCLASPVVLVKSESDRQPAAFWLYDPASAKLTSIGSARPAIQAARMGRRDFFYYPARDGLRIPVYVTLPLDGHKPWPAVVLVHGGPWVRGTSWEWSAEAQFLASRGYAVIEPQFRGTVGFGDHLFRSSFKQWGLAMQDDLADAAVWAVGQGYADPKRIAIAGASYGGYATLMGLIKNPELFRCGFEWVGVTDIGLMYSLAWNDASLEQLTYRMPRMIGDPDHDAAQLEATSPLHNAARLNQPLLMAYGSDDRRVPLAQGAAFRDAVASHNNQVEWVVYAGEGHGWRREPDNIDFWSRVDRFLDANLKHASP